MGKLLASIIVPALNEEKHIKHTLLALSKQTVPRDRYEIIVSDSSSTDRTASIAKKFADKVVICKRHSAGFGRTFGARHAKSEVLGFIDADTIVSNTWVEGLIETLSLPKIIACSGPLENIERDSLSINLFYKWWSFQTRASIAFHYPIIPGYNFGVRKKEFFKLGGFAAINCVCDDMDLSLRLGKIGTLAFSNKMGVKTSARRQKEIPIHQHMLNGAKFALFGKGFSWNEYRKDFAEK
ncbi:Glycosyltransferase AglI [uncultured archaeon]|nr:Glycosyltransferase AglI [uncultured archaeon]